MNPAPKTALKALDALTDEDIREAIAKDPDAAPEIDEAAFAQFRPAEEVVPDIVAQYRARRGGDNDESKPHL